MQCRRETKVGPEPAHIWRIYGFVKSKIDKENAVTWSKKWCDLQKKNKIFTEILTVFTVKIRWSSEKNVFTEILTIFAIEIRWCP